MENNVDYLTTAHSPIRIGWLEKKLTPDQIKYELERQLTNLTTTSKIKE